MLSREEYLKTLPRKISSAGALFYDKDWWVLLVETTYKEDFDIPGWIIESWESPKEACEREIKEELWVSISLEKLLVCEYQLLDEFESYAFIFDGGLFSYEKKIALSEEEIKNIHFLPLNDIWDKTTKHLKKRIEKSIQAREGDITLYYETNYSWKK